MSGHQRIASIPVKSVVPSISKDVEQKISQATAGKLELTIKINELPASKTVQNNWKRFFIDCGGQIISITVKPKIWNKLENANRDFPMWVAAIAGTMGQKTKEGFILDNPSVQVFERKPKEPKNLESEVAS